MQASGLPAVLMDAPYRLGSLLRDVAPAFGKEKEVVLIVGPAPAAQAGRGTRRRRRPSRRQS